MEQTRITLIIQFAFRGLVEEYSQSFALAGAPPASPAGWDTLTDALINAWKPCVQAGQQVKKAYCYVTDDPHDPNVYSRDFSPVIQGTLPNTTGIVMDGNAAVWVRWKTLRKTSNGRSIYLRKYFHGAVAANPSAGVAADPILPAQKTALLAFGLKMRDGTFAEGRTLTAPGHTDTLTAHAASDWIGYRQLRKGSRRPPP